MHRTLANKVSHRLFLTGLTLLMLLVIPSIVFAAADEVIDAAGPADFTAGSPSTDNHLDSFSVVSTGNGGRGLTSITVTTTGTANIAAVKIKDNTGVTTHGTQATPSGNTWVIDTSGNKVTAAKDTTVTFRIYVDIVGGASGTVTGYVSSFITSANTNLGSTDVAGTTITGYTAGCSTVNPSISLSGGQSIGASQTASYTITLTNNDSVACADTDFTVAVQAGGDSGNTGSFVTPSVTNPASCVITLAAQATDNTSCTLDVTSNGAPTDTDVMNTIIEVTSGTHATQTANVNTTITLSGGDCSFCHKYAPVDGVRDFNTGDFIGSHGVHAGGWLVPTHIADCTTCHTDTTSGETDKAHRRGTINLAASIPPGGTYSKGTSFAQSNNPTMGTCSVTYCHGSGTPTWGGGAMNCTSCHNDGEGNGYPETGTQFRTAAAIGAHTAHMEGTAGLMDGGVQCIDCHANYTNESDAGHFDTTTPADVPFPAAGDADLNGTATSYTAGSCTVYCHAANLPGTTGANNGSDTTPPWSGSSTGCNYCHGMPPNGTHPANADCSSCHDHTDATDDGFTGGTNIAKHINGVIEVSGCTGCHGTDPKEYPPVSFYGTNKSTANGVGAHVTHMEKTATIMSKENVPGEATDHWCAECHTTTRGAGGHDDGYPAEVSFANAVESAYGSVTEAFTSEDGNPDTGSGGTCVTYCHSAYASAAADTRGTDTQPAWGTDWGNYGDGSPACATACHLVPPQTAAHDKGGSVWYALNECNGCHPDTVTDTAAMPTIGTAFHINGALDVDASCTGCHSSAAHVSGVGVGSPHLKLVSGGADAACEACHPGNLRGAQHAKSGDANVILIANNTNLGINYVNGTNGYSGDNGIVLGGDNTVGTTEAEICWNCHDDSNPDISEWDGSSATYNYGSVTNNNLNWFTTTWTSANFSYKDGPLTTAINTDGDPASTHGTKGGAAGVDTAGEIGCTFCHDVHDTNKTNGDTFSGAPYLRGSWVSSVYNEDGAPGRWTDRGDTLSSSQTATWGGTYGAVPRGSAATNNGMGGFWIDQNSANHGANTYADHAGLCTLCHGDGDGIPGEAADVNAIETLWTGHENPVAGGTNSSNKDVFRNGDRNGDGTWNGGMWMGAQNSTGQSGNRYYSYRSDRQPYVAPTIGSDYTYNNFAWTGLSIGDGTVQVDFHNFTCSKCHNPHASRLPKLMITNCLDTERNTWDDAYINATNMNQWDGTGSGVGADVNYGTGEHAKSSTAQNCHRYITVGGTEPGWNAVTPWQ